jgi:hypothetical protein
MKNLKAYVESKNQWSQIFGRRQLSLASAADRQAIAEAIDAELSPENLTCDGELSRGQVQARYRSLTTAAAELKVLDPAVKFYEYN